MKLKRNRYFKISAFLAALGFIDSCYLTFVRYLNSNPICNVSTECEMVLTSRYSAIGPIPLAVIGIFFYALVAVMSIYLIYNFKKDLFNFYYQVISIGFIFSLGLIVLQIFIIGAVCQYCLFSELMSTLLLYFVIKNRRLELKKRKL